MQVIQQPKDACKYGAIRCMNDFIDLFSEWRKGAGEKVSYNDFWAPCRPIGI